MTGQNRVTIKSVVFDVIHRTQGTIYGDLLPLLAKHERRNPSLSAFKKVAERIRPER